MQRSININLNLMHTTVNKKEKKKHEEPKHDTEEDPNEAQVVG